jgi:hypothetical protein
MRIARAERLLLAAACLLSAGAWAADFGTLFHSAEERERLDRLRRGEPVSQDAEEPQRRKEITGFVMRSDGRGGTAFVDGAPVHVDAPEAKLLDPKAVRGYSAKQSERLRIEPRPPR